ncbi:hypothetical protein Sliba_76910 [Streptomyces nigrescens]|uniref:Uncharacterized protein n=1 Tax=Streptomyces nigrescens TaxID=1920 RepID=A0A640TUE2_STRNI|nr:hypothetical protein Sliba_76910 [Streptomyces libani subsp. libani]
MFVTFGEWANTPGGGPGRGGTLAVKIGQGPFVKTRPIHPLRLPSPTASGLRLRWPAARPGATTCGLAGRLVPVRRLRAELRRFRSSGT